MIFRNVLPEVSEHRRFIITDTYEELERRCADIYADIEKILESDNYDKVAEYFDDMLDVEFSVDTRMRLRGVRVTLALGGPGIWLDTNTGEIRAAWGSTKYTFEIPTTMCDQINDYYEEMFDLLR